MTTKRRRHHVVSAGYQRFFAAGNTVQLCDKSPPAGRRRIRLAGVNDVFVRRHFNSYAVDGRYFTDLEDAWGRIETLVLPLVRSWNEGRELETSRDAARVLAALHFGRSFGYRYLFKVIAEETRQQQIDEIVASPGTRETWERLESRPFDEDILRELAAASFDDLVDPSGAFVIQRMVHHYMQVYDKLSSLEVVAYTPASSHHDFILGDSPFVFWDDRGVRVGHRGRLALGDAQTMMLPLGRRLAVCFTTTKEPDMDVMPIDVQAMNIFSWRCAYNQVIAHPETDLERALGMSLRTASGHERDTQGHETARTNEN